MTDYVTPKLPNRVIAVTRGADAVFTCRRRAAGTLIDWDATLFISIDIDKAAPTRIDAEVTGPNAVVRIESTVADQTRTGMTWQVLVSQASSPTLETPVLVGTFERNDGK